MPKLVYLVYIVGEALLWIPRIRLRHLHDKIRPKKFMIISRILSLVVFSDLRFILVRLKRSKQSKIYQNMKIQKRPNRAETKSDLENPSKQRLVPKLWNIN